MTWFSEYDDSCGYPSDLENATGGHYKPAADVAAARALRWVPFDTAVSAVRSLKGASHEDLRLRAPELSASLSRVFFDGGGAGKAFLFPPPFSAGARFPEDTLFVCADRPPLAPSLRAAARAMVQVAVKDADYGACDHYFDSVGWLMWLLAGDAGRPAPDVVFRRATFESAFALEWAPAADADPAAL